MGEERRVLVVGGGIAGLATAHALGRNGIPCDVIERSTAWSHPGAGMYLPANAVRALDDLGFGEALRHRAREITQQRLLDSQGRELLEVDLADLWGPTGPCLAIGRRDLHEIMRENLLVRLGVTATRLQDEDSRIRATLSDGSSSIYDLVVGADGINSWVRRIGLGGGEPRFVGQASWRLIIDGFPEILQWTVLLGRGRAFLTIPLGAGLVYCYADVNAPTAFDLTGGDPAKLAALFGDFAEPVPAILTKALSDGIQPYFAPIEEVVQRPWVRGRVVVVGDAAHAMSPNMAEGAGLAVEDALILANIIASNRNLEEFEAHRRRRVDHVRAQTHRRDRTRNLPPFIRRTTLRLAGRRIFHGNYKPLRLRP
jgi:2-polyprenyl-6-methoxyphenol hydroxylase-like FAD-dependent oxidoreductase